jgi:hypothetical protein
VAEVLGEFHELKDFSKSEVNNAVKSSFNIIGKKGGLGFMVVAGVRLI